MYKQFRSVGVVMLMALTMILSACGGGDSDTRVGNIVETAREDAKFTIFSEAVSAVGLESTLTGPGPYTVFAPTNSAFGALLSELGIDKARMLADKALLTRILSYHVLPARVPRADIPFGKPVTTVQGDIVKIESVGNDLVITDGRNRTTKITQTDIQATNGVLHAVDNVLLPPDKNIVQTAQAAPQFSILVEAVTAAGLGDTLSGKGPFTVFAPTNDAFAALLTELGLSKDQLLANKTLLTRVLTYHVLPTRVLKADVPVDTPIRTVQGDTLTINAGLNITDQRRRSAKIINTDIFTSNGVIHAIDKVILPTP